MTSTFNDWIKITNQNVKKEEEQKNTHLLLNGGILYVLEKDRDIFLKKYSNGIIKKEKIYLVETREKYFKLFFDLDFMCNEKNYELCEHNKIFDKIIDDVNEIIYNLYEFKIGIVTTADIKIIKKIKDSLENNKEINNFIKKGFHIHYPEIIVTKETALNIRKKCITKLRTIYGNNYELFENNFNDIVDEHVFTSSGLRMTGSRKGHFMKGKDFIDEGRPYEFYKLLAATQDRLDSEENEYKEDMYKLIKDTSIFTTMKEENKYRKDSDVQCIECEDQEKENNYENENEGSNMGTVGDWDRLDKNDLKYNEILRFFKTYMRDYDIKDIKRIFHNNNIYIICTKSKYCLNIKKEHNSCGIYFKLDKNGLIQKCFCRCDKLEGRKYGYCKDFSSTPIPNTPHIRKILGFKEIEKAVNNKSIKQLKKNENNYNILEVRELLYNQFTNKSPPPTRGGRKK